MSKKKLFSLAVIVIMIAILSFSTLAWFNDADSVTNQFYVADSNNTSADQIFSVDVYEEVDTNNDGIPDAKEDIGLEFKDVVPGDVLPKAPIVENTGKYAQWIRLTITFGSTKAWNTLVDNAETGLAGPINLLTKAANFDANWKGVSLTTVVENGVEYYVYTYYLQTALQPGQTVPVFTEVNIPTTLEQADFFAIKDEGITLDVKAEAVQLELGNSAEAAFAAFEQTP